MTDDTAANSAYSYDVIIVGAGPAGYLAAIRAAQLGLKTSVVEAENVGGTCLNWGCIPTKALLASAHVLRTVRGASAYGIKAENISFDFPAVIERSRKIVQHMNAGIKFLLKKNGVELISGYARLAGAERLEVEPKDSGEKIILTAPHILLATGARPAVIKGIEPDGQLILNSRQALLDKNIPASVLLIGGGAIGLELADVFNTFGAKVTVAEGLPEIIPFADGEIAAAARKSFTAKGIEILTSVKVTAVTKLSAPPASASSDSSAGGEVEVTFTKADGSEEKRRFAKVISAVGITPNTDDIGLASSFVATERGRIITDEWGATNVKGVYAIGDITTHGPALAHKAEAEGILCVEKLSGKVAGLKPLAYDLIPSCLYTHPEIAGFGLTEQAAEAKGLKVKIGRFPLAANGRAVASGYPEGMAKVIIGEDGSVLGAWLIGADVTELISILSPVDIRRRIFPHPSLSEIIPEALLQAEGAALNI